MQTSYFSMPCRLAAIPAAVLCLAAALPAMAQTQSVQLTTLIALTGSTGPAVGVRPFYAPQWSAAEKKLVGTTRSGAALINGLFTQGVSYSLDPLAQNKGYTASPLGEPIGFSITNLVELPGGRLFGASSHAAPAPGSYSPTRAAFTLGGGTARVEPVAIDMATSPRGQMSIDPAGRVYLGGSQGVCSPTTPSSFLIRREADGSLSNLFSFCDPSVWSNPSSGARFSKGGVPGLTLWSDTDQALYGVSSFTTRLGAPYEGVPSNDTAGGALVRIAGQALNKEKLVADDIEVLHFFARDRDGIIGVSDTGTLALAEDGEWLYGTTTLNTAASQGRVWRMHKSDPDSFAIAVNFAPDLSVAHEPRQIGVPAVPRGQLVRAADGNLYGVASRDSRQVNFVGANRLQPVGAGLVYRIVPGAAADRADDRLEIVHYFDPETSGAVPVGLTAGPVVEGKQLLFGATEFGGAPGNACYAATSAVAGDSTCTGNGTIFQLSVPLPPVTVDSFLGNGGASVTLAAGSRLTLEWNSTGAANCTAAGAWSGSKQASGTEALGPLAAGKHDYTLSCISDAGVVSAVKSVSVTVTAPVDSGSGENPGGGGGGGGPILPSALLLLALASARRAMAVRVGR